jgi:hypothetical protein
METGSWIETDDAAPVSPRQEACFVMVGRKAYLVGGQGSRWPVDIYDPVTRRWTTGSPAPVVVNHHQCEVLDGKIWILSAWVHVSTTFGSRDEDNSKIYIYDTKTDLWSTKEGLPARRRRGSSAAVAVGRMIYVSHGKLEGHLKYNPRFKFLYGAAPSVGWFEYYDVDTDSHRLARRPKPKRSYRRCLLTRIEPDLCCRRAKQPSFR